LKIVINGNVLGGNDETHRASCDHAHLLIAALAVLWNMPRH
jgi:hypothetical protein